MISTSGQYTVYLNSWSISHQQMPGGWEKPKLGITFKTKHIEWRNGIVLKIYILKLTQWSSFLFGLLAGVCICNFKTSDAQAFEISIHVLACLIYTGSLYLWTLKITMSVQDDAPFEMRDFGNKTLLFPKSTLLATVNRSSVNICMTVHIMYGV